MGRDFSSFGSFGNECGSPRFQALPTVAQLIKCGAKSSESAFKQKKKQGRNPW